MTATQDASDAINGFPPSNHESIYKTVQNHYGSTARSNDNSSYGSTVASAFGYPVEELTANPSEANLGLSCGNPFAIANLREGETVIDLGSGAGFDVFQAARKVGASGTVIGVDMNKVWRFGLWRNPGSKSECSGIYELISQHQEMLSRANSIKHKVGAENVSFVESRITNINLPTATADCIISNCVINLVPEAEKQSAFNEMFRLLKPKGRIAISDILLKRDLPNELKSNIALYVGCIAGASHVEEYERYMRGAGFQGTSTAAVHLINAYDEKWLIMINGRRYFDRGRSERSEYLQENRQ